MKIIKSRKLQRFIDSKSFHTIYKNRDKSVFIYLPEVSSYLELDFQYLFDKTGNLNIEKLFLEEFDYHISGESSAVTLNIKTNIIYIYSLYSEHDYVYNTENLNDNDILPINIIKQNKIPYDSLPLDNFLELVQNWYEIWKGQTPFALLYQDEKDWIHCKAFDSEEEMDQFIKQHS